MICKICKSHSEFLFTKQVLKKYAVGYHRCAKCRFVQTDEPYWLDEAYDQAINLSDTGYIARNLFFRNKLKYFFKIKYSPDDVFLDFGAGYGVFTRMMRDLNFDFRWSDEYTHNIFTRGFEATPEQDRYAAITLFEVAEHLAEPIEQFSLLIQKTDNIVFSTELAPRSSNSLENWWYLSAEHGQHIALWSIEAIRELAGYFGMHAFSSGSLHFLTRKRLRAHEKAVIKLSALPHRVETKLFGTRIWVDQLKLR